MDKDVEIMYLPPAEERITRHSLKVKLSPAYNRKPLPESFETGIDVIWNKRVTSNPRLWNGSKFRIESVSDAGGSVTFNLGVTSYKAFIGTNWSPNAQAMRQLGQQDYSNTQV